MGRGFAVDPVTAVLPDLLSGNATSWLPFVAVVAPRRVAEFVSESAEFEGALRFGSTPRTFAMGVRTAAVVRQRTLSRKLMSWPSWPLSESWWPSVPPRGLGRATAS